MNPFSPSDAEKVCSEQCNNKKRQSHPFRIPSQNNGIPTTSLSPSLPLTLT